MIYHNKNPYSIALIYWKRSANQMNVDSRIKVGDYYFYGLGINDLGLDENDDIDDEEEDDDDENEDESEEEDEDESEDEDEDEEDNTSEEEEKENIKKKKIIKSTKEEEKDKIKNKSKNEKNDNNDNNDKEKEEEEENYNIIPNNVINLFQKFMGKMYGDQGKPNYKTAFTYYQVAADNEMSSMAMWNLGFMYEYGIGIKKVNIDIFHNNKNKNIYILNKINKLKNNDDKIN